MGERPGPVSVAEDSTNSESVEAPDLSQGAGLIGSIDQAPSLIQKLAILDAIRESASARALLDKDYAWRDYLASAVLDLGTGAESQSFDDQDPYQLMTSIDSAASLADKLSVLGQVRRRPDARAILDSQYEWRDFLATVGLDLTRVSAGEAVSDEMQAASPAEVAVGGATEAVVSVPASSERKHTGFSRKATRLAALGVAGAVGAAIFGPKIERIMRQPSMSERMKIALDQLQQPITEAPRVAKDSIIEDETYVHSGSVLSYADILIRLDRLSKEVFSSGTAPDTALLSRYTQTSRLLLSAKALWPEATKFVIEEHDGTFGLHALEWVDQVEVKEKVHAYVLVVGGELEAVTTAIEAADKGLTVALLFARPLGGLSTDSAGNMRFFDGVQEAPKTAVQQKLLHDGLGMSADNQWALPQGVSDKLQTYLSSSYPGIRLIPTRSYDSMHIDYNGDEIVAVTTEEGIKVAGKEVIDMDPESRLAEKVGLPATFEMPNMATGLVFDVQGLGQADFKDLSQSTTVSPERILQICDISPQQAESDPTVLYAIKHMELASKKEKTYFNPHTAYGFDNVGTGFDLYMHLQELKEVNAERRATLHDLNRMRNMDGFNMAFSDHQATINSLNYNLPKAIQQHSHNIAHDSSLAPFRDVEIPLLQRYFGSISSKPVSIRIPDQFYVRKAALAYQTLHQYSESDMSGHRSDLWMTYPMDVRGTRPLDRYDHAADQVHAAAKKIGLAAWDINPYTTITSISNLYLNNKSSLSPKFVGNLRIIQNLIGTGVALVDKIADGSIGADASRVPSQQKPRAAKRIKHNVIRGLQYPRVVVGAQEITLELPDTIIR